MTGHSRLGMPRSAVFFGTKCPEVNPLDYLHVLLRDVQKVLWRNVYGKSEHF